MKGTLNESADESTDLSADIIAFMDGTADEEPETEEEQPEDASDESGDDTSQESVDGGESDDVESGGDRSDEGESGEGLDDGDGDESESSEDDGESAEGSTDKDDQDRLEPPEHWSAVDKERFTSIPKKAQEFVLDRHKSMEGDYTRKSQEIASVRRQWESVEDALAPYEAEFSAAGLDKAGAVRKLAHWHQALKTGGRPAILSLAQTYGIDLTEEDNEPQDPHLSAIQRELSELKAQTTRSNQEAQQRQQAELLSTIEAFEHEKGGDGKLLHPYFRDLQDDITRLFQAGLTTDLNDGYSKALALRPDLKPVKAPVVTKVDKAEKVKQAKRAATGVKSSGAVGKRNREAMSLEQEIAAQFK